MCNFEKKWFVLDTDARSRIAIYMINHADNPLIAQLGNLSHDAFRGGFFSGDGCMAVSGDASCILLPRVLQSPEPPLIGAAMLPSSVSLPLDCDLTVSDERISPVTPGNMPFVLSNMTDQYDFIFLCRTLGLDKKDFDHLNNGIFIRTFVDDLMERLPGWNWLPIRDHLGCFVRMNVLCQNVVFELKTFKFVDRPGVYSFLFANIEDMKGKIKLMFDDSAAMARKVREVALAQRQKEREYLQTKRTIERIRTASGF